MKLNNNIYQEGQYADTMTKNEVEDEAFRLNVVKNAQIITKFQRITLLQTFFMIVFAAASFYGIYHVFETTRQSVYVVTPTGTLKAEVREGGNKRNKVEIDFWVKDWAEYAFAYSPQTFESRVNQSLSKMTKKQGQSFATHLASLKIMDLLQKFNCETKLSIDSLKHLPKTDADLGDDIYRVKVYGKQTFKIAAQDVDDFARPFAYQLTLRPVTRVSGNHVGLTMVKYDVLDTQAVPGGNSNTPAG